jgi:hypothetical protein
VFRECGAHSFRKERDYHRLLHADANALIPLEGYSQGTQEGYSHLGHADAHALAPLEVGRLQAVLQQRQDLGEDPVTYSRDGPSRL